MPNILKRCAAPCAALLFVLAAVPARADTDISVMTQNQYLGGDLAPLLGALDPAAFNAAVLTALRQVAANDFPRRAERLAGLIAKRRPHLVGLQEVWSFHCFDLYPAPLPPGYGCDDPTIAGAFNDHLSVTLAALGDAGADYYEAATVEDLDLRDVLVPGVPAAGVPFLIGGYPALLVAWDRDVILARGDVDARPAIIPCARPSVDGCNFQAFITATTPAGGDLRVERGFVAVDATVDDLDYRFVNTHLETREPVPGNPVSRFFQAAQSAELIQTLALTTPPGRTLIVVGDINSDPEHPVVPGPLPLPPPFDAGIVPPYMQFTAYGGYVDIWALAGGPGDGLTCCQAADLSNAESELYERVDMIFARDMPDPVKDVEVLGDRARDKTPPPALWPSDHNGVTAEMDF